MSIVLLSHIELGPVTDHKAAIPLGDIPAIIYEGGVNGRAEDTDTVCRMVAATGDDLERFR